MNRTLKTVAGVLLAGAALPGPQDGAPRQRLSVFYFGNSYTENAMPPFHADLGRSVRKEWNTGAMVGPGWTIFMNLHGLENNRPVWSSRGGGAAQEVLRNQSWDAVVVQPFSWVGLHRDKTELGGWIPKEKQGEYADDVGDVESASRLFRFFLKEHPRGECLLYEQWPAMERKLGPDGKPFKEPTPGPGGRGDEDWAPDREAFDYVKHWETVAYDPAKKWEGSTTRTRDYFHKLMEELKGGFPDLWTQGRLRYIPVAEVYNALEKKMRAGQIPGLGGIAWFYSDLGHQRMGLPRYALAATFYAVLFRDRPHGLDWRIYNDPDRYLRCTEETRFYAHKPDLGELLPITPELARAVHDTLWEVVSRHPYTRMKEQ